MKRIACLAVMFALLIPPATTVAQQPVTLAFSTLDAGTAWYVYGATMAEMLRKTLPAGSNIDVKPRAGGVGNPRLVAKNETPLGLSFTVTNRWAYEGKEAYDAKLDNLRALVGGLDTYYLVAVVPKKVGIATVKDIKDKKLAVKGTTQPVGSLGEFAARQLMRSAGMSLAKLLQDALLVYEGDIEGGYAPAQVRLALLHLQERVGNGRQRSPRAGSRRGGALPRDRRRRGRLFPQREMDQHQRGDQRHKNDELASPLHAPPRRK